MKYKKGTILKHDSRLVHIKGLVVDVRRDSEQMYVVRWQSVDRDYYYRQDELENNPYVSLHMTKPEDHFTDDELFTL